MSAIVRSCDQCRRSKVKCDLVRPVCSRCQRRATECTGYQTEGEYIFRDESINAQRRSERARRETEEGRAPAITYEIDTSQTARQSTPQSSADPHEFGLELQFPWLNEYALRQVPEPLRRDINTRAVELFIMNWIVYPSALSPGYMHHLPILYENTPMDSILYHAVRAIAFADMKHVTNGNLPNLNVQSQRSYGAAIARLRGMVTDTQELADDQTLTALLLIDAFETMYLGRTDPLGLHNDAMHFILQARGSEQLHTRVRSCLYRVMSYRLQARQLLLGEDLTAAQQALLGQVNQQRPEFRVLCDVSKIVHCCAKAKDLTEGGGSDSTVEQIMEMNAVLRAMLDLISEIDAFTSSISTHWKPASMEYEPGSGIEDINHPMHHFTCPTTLSYSDLALASIWLFHAASQIMLREAFISIMRQSASMPRQQLVQDPSARVQIEALAIDGLCSSIIRSTPKVMGFDEESHVPPSAPQGKSLGRFFGLFAMTVVRRAEYTSEQHKTTASKFMDWIDLTYRLSSE